MCYVVDFFSDVYANQNIRRMIKGTLNLKSQESHSFWQGQQIWSFSVSTTATQLSLHLTSNRRFYERSLLLLWVMGLELLSYTRSSAGDVTAAQDKCQVSHGAWQSRAPRPSPPRGTSGLVVRDEILPWNDWADDTVSFLIHILLVRRVCQTGTMLKIFFLLSFFLSFFP